MVNDPTIDPGPDPLRTGEDPFRGMVWPTQPDPHRIGEDMAALASALAEERRLRDEAEARTAMLEANLCDWFDSPDLLHGMECQVTFENERCNCWLSHVEHALAATPETVRQAAQDLKLGRLWREAERRLGELSVDSLYGGGYLVEWGEISDENKAEGPTLEAALRAALKDPADD